jgi:hypothetical protein
MSTRQVVSPAKHRVSNLLRLISLERRSPMRRSTFQSQRFHRPLVFTLAYSPILSRIIRIHTPQLVLREGLTGETDYYPARKPVTIVWGATREAIVRNDLRRNVVSREELNHMEVEASAEPVFVADLSALTVKLLQNLPQQRTRIC